MISRFPIILPTIKGAQSFLHEVMRDDLELLNRHYHVFPESVSEDLAQDLKILMAHDIARQFDLVFYDPIYTQKIYLKRTYQLVRQDQPAAGYGNVLNEAFFTDGMPLPEPFEFDIFVYFSNRFLALNEFEQATALKGFQFKWFDFSKAFHKYFMQDAVDTIQPASPPVSDRGPVVGTVSKPARNPFAENKTLFIASYTDSRRLIAELVAVAKGLQLTPIQWTFSEGFMATGDKHAGRYAFNDKEYFLQNAKTSPLDVLTHIKNNGGTNTIYLLEDFHYYLLRENQSGSDYAELISVVKSLPSVLKELHSLVVILSPSVDLPPEIAPIFEVIRDFAQDTKCYQLEKYGSDLTKMVLEHKIKPVIGREGEIKACLKVLSQMESNNPLLVGKAGVGKTAVIEGLAMQIVAGQVPPAFRQKRIIALNLNAMVSGTKYRGEFEKRLEAVLEEVRTNSRQVIVFIDEIHTLLGMGASEGATGAENVLKPSLARGEFPCIGATTFEEYKKHIEPDKALSRRFQVVEIPEPSVEETLVILKGVRSVYENHHQVQISDLALERCVILSNAMLSNQHFPGKAVKMLDQVCASASLAGMTVVTPEFVAEEIGGKC